MIPAEYWEAGRIKPEALSELPGPFTVTEVAMALRCSTDYIHKCIKAGTVEAGRVGRNYRLNRDEAAKLVRAVLG